VLGLCWLLLLLGRLVRLVVVVLRPGRAGAQVMLKGAAEVGVGLLDDEDRLVGGRLRGAPEQRGVGVGERRVGLALAD